MHIKEMAIFIPLIALKLIIMNQFDYNDHYNEAQLFINSYIEKKSMPKGSIPTREELLASIKDEDWEPIYTHNPHLVFAKKQKVWKCTTCDTPFFSGSGAGNHMKGSHGIDIYGNAVPGKAKKETDSSSESTEEKPLDLKPKPEDSETTIATKKVLSEKEDAEKLIPGEISNLEQYVYSESSKELAGQAVKIVTDYNLMFLFHKTRRLFPPTFTLADTLTACFEHTLRTRFNVMVDVSYNVEQLNKDEAEYILEVNQQWDEFDRLKKEAGGKLGQ